MRAPLGILSGLWLAAGASGTVFAQGAPGAGAAVAPGIRATAIAPEGLTLRADSARNTDPGTSVTLRIVLENSDDSPRKVSLRTILPDGWRLLSGATEEVVPAKGRSFRLLQCAIPGDAAAGEFPVVQVASAPGLEEDLRAQTIVTVRARRSLSVTLVDEPYFAASGSSYTATFLVSNRGNVATKVHLQAKSELDYSATMDTLTGLAPGESRQVSVRVNTAGGSSTEPLRHHLYLIAEPVGGLSDDGVAQSKAVASVRVIPRGGGASAPWHNIPFNFKLSSQTQQFNNVSGSTSQAFEVSGSGPLIEGGSSLLEVFARSPQPLQSQFTERDEYHVALTAPHYSAQLGDQYFVLTPLSTTGLIASGLSGHLNLGRWTAGAFYGRDRWTPYSLDRHAAFLGYDATPRLHLSANVLDGGLFGTGPLGTLDAQFRPTEKSLLEVEHGNRLNGQGAGTMVRAAGRHGWLSFELRHLEADSAYPASIRGSRQDGATIALTPTSRLRLDARVDERTTSTTLRVFTPELIRNPARISRTAAMSADYASLISAGVRFYQDQDGGATASGSNLPIAERAAWLRLGTRIKGFSLSGAVERGTSDDIAGGAPRPFSSTRLQAGFILFGRQSFSGFVEHYTGERRYSSISDNVVTAGGSTQVRLGGLSLTVAGAGAPSYLLRAPIDPLQSRGSWIDGTVGYSWSAGRSLDLRIRAVNSGNGLPVGTTARLSYSIPLGMPVGRSRSVSRVTGRVYDAETGLGIANALVRIGDRSALTDDDGRVAFGGVSPDRYPVMLDLGERQGGVGLQDGATEVATVAGHTSDLTLRVVRMGRIRGKLQLFDAVEAPRQPGDTLRMRKGSGLAGVVVSFVNGTEERRAVSDTGGWFELRDARPGSWRIIVPSAQLPAQHYVQGDSVRVVELAMGATRVIEINVLPRQRKILPLDAAPTQPYFQAAPAPQPIPLRQKEREKEKSRSTSLIESSSTSFGALVAASPFRSKCAKSCLVPELVWPSIAAATAAVAPVGNAPMRARFMRSG
jgi:hypothetical protein